MFSTSARVCAGIVAVVAWLGEWLFLLSHLRATGSLLQAAWIVVAYLTDWTNLLVAWVCTAIALGAVHARIRRWSALTTTAILLVGIMFAAVGGWGNVAKLDTSSVLTHAVTPIAMSLLWLAALRDGTLQWRDIGVVMLFPMVYLTQMFARGVLLDGFPYPQVDVEKVGWGSALIFAGIVLVTFLAIGLAVIALDRLLGRPRRVA